MKVMVISLLAAFSISSASAIEFIINSPKTAILEEEFAIIIESSEQLTANYDVKAYVHQPVKEYSEIFDNGVWKSPHFYLNSAFPSSKEFKLKSHFIGETKVCVRLRESGKSSFTEECAQIEIMSKNPNNEDNIPEEEEEPTAQIESNEKNMSTSTLLQINEEAPSNKEKIFLNSPQNAQNERIITKQQKIRQGVFYGFTLFLVIVIVLLSLRKL